MVKVLYFHTKDVVEILNAKLDGKVLEPEHIDAKFYIEDDIPSIRLLKRNIFGKLGEKSEPLYICYSDAVVPATVKFKGGKPVATLTFRKENLHDPETFKNTTELKILGNLLKPRFRVSSIAMLFFGLLIGILIMYLLIQFKVI
ncbi:MAG: hypothetical protein ACPLX8_02200, partial [Nanopusillaceae archaeon]